MVKKLILCLIFILMGIELEAASPQAQHYTIVSECLSLSGGKILDDSTSADGEMCTQILLPSKYDNFEIVKLLNPVMAKMHSLYDSLKPWKSIETGQLISFSLRKDEPRRAVSICYYPDDSILLIVNSEPEVMKDYIPDTAFKKFVSYVEWVSVILTEGFIIEESGDYDKGSIDVKIQLPKITTNESFMKDLSPLCMALSEKALLSSPWEISESGAIECSMSVMLEKSSNVCIKFSYSAQTHTLLISFF